MVVLVIKLYSIYCTYPGSVSDVVKLTNGYIILITPFRLRLMR